MIEAKIDTDKKIMFAIAIVVIILGIRYTVAYFSSKDTSNANKVTTGSAKISYTENENGIINADGIVPINDDDIKDSATRLSFNVENIGTTDITYSIKLVDLTIHESMINKEFKWAVYSGDQEIDSGDFSNAKNNENYSLIQNESLNEGKNKDYILYIWISETGVEQNSMIDKTFESKVQVEAISK